MPTLAYVNRAILYHKAVGSAIEEFYPDPLAEHYEELAYHFAQGEAWQKAMTYSILAYHHEAVEQAQRAHAGFLFGLATFFIGHANLAKGEYDEALRLCLEGDEVAQRVYLALGIPSLPGESLDSMADIRQAFVLG
jgi:hypothetical protein